MGRSRTPKYRVEYLMAAGSTSALTPSCWSGLPSPKRLIAHVEGVQRQLDDYRKKGRIQVARIIYARIIEQRVDRVVCEWIDGQGAATVNRGESS